MARRRPIPGSGPRCHDARHRLIAPRGCRETSLPASHHCCPSASQGVCDALDHAKITQSTADAATNSRPRSAIRRRQPRPAHLRPKATPRQIPIDGRPPNQPPRVPSWEAFGSRPSVRLDRSRPADIRNPSPTATLAARGRGVSYLIQQRTLSLRVQTSGSALRVSRLISTSRAPACPPPMRRTAPRETSEQGTSTTGYWWGAPTGFGRMTAARALDAARLRAGTTKAPSRSRYPGPRAHGQLAPRHLPRR